MSVSSYLYLVFGVFLHFSLKIRYCWCWLLHLSLYLQQFSSIYFFSFSVTYPTFSNVCCENFSWLKFTNDCSRFDLLISKKERQNYLINPTQGISLNIFFCKKFILQSPKLYCSSTRRFG